MGFFSFILSAFKFRKKETTKERLQHIDEELERLETSTRRNQQLQKSAVLYLIIFSILIYCGALFYLWYFPISWSQWLMYSIPFLLFALIIFFTKNILIKFFKNKSSANANRAKELKNEKKKLLEDVMDNETYKVAKEILQKYDPHRSLVEESESPPVKQSPKPPTSEGQELRRRNIQSAPSDAPSKQARPVPHTTTNGYPVAPVMVQRSPAIGNGSPMRSPVPMGRGAAPRVPVPIAPILPRERSVFDKVCDFVIGDGPTNRFALICKQCCGHNGMVLVEEFTFTSYRCCYCGFFNPARKKRLNAPKLENKRHTSKSTASDSANSTDAEGSNKVEDNEEKVLEEDITQNGNTTQDESTEETKSIGDTNPIVDEKTDDVETNGTNTVSSEVTEDACSETEKTNGEER